MDFGFSFAGQFWSNFSEFQTSPRFNNLLEKEDLSLEEVIIDSDTVSEIRNSNAKLLEFLNSDRLHTMVDYVTVEPTEDEGYLRGFKLPFVTSEILTVENSVLLDRFYTCSDLMFHFFDFLSTGEALNYTLAGYFSKILVSLF